MLESYFIVYSEGVIGLQQAYSFNRLGNNFMSPFSTQGFILLNWLITLSGFIWQHLYKAVSCSGKKYTNLLLCQEGRTLIRWDNSKAACAAQRCLQGSSDHFVHFLSSSKPEPIKLFISPARHLCKLFLKSCSPFVDWICSHANFSYASFHWCWEKQCWCPWRQRCTCVNYTPLWLRGASSSLKKKLSWSSEKYLSLAFQKHLLLFWQTSKLHWAEEKLIFSFLQEGLLLEFDK